MTSALVTPSGVPTSATFDEAPLRLITDDAGDLHLMTYRVHLPAPAPSELRVSLELGREESGVWAHIPEFDISAEAHDLNEAFHAVIAAAREWLSFIQDEQVELAPELQGQAKYVVLLDAPVFSWFKGFSFVD